jgi:hypothetical protein
MHLVHFVCYICEELVLLFILKSNVVMLELTVLLFFINQYFRCKDFSVGSSFFLLLHNEFAYMCADLSTVRDERIVLNPQSVMHALSFYVSHFNLTRQQARCFLPYILLESLPYNILDLTRNVLPS